MHDLFTAAHCLDHDTGAMGYDAPEALHYTGSKPMRLTELCEYLDDYLQTDALEDYPGAFNGLQLERLGDIQSLAVAVDACQATLEAAVTRGADLLIVHHGLLWGGPGPFTGPLYRRLSAALGADLGVYSSHLPLDAHPEVGNNAELVRALGFVPGERFGEHKGRALGYVVECDLRRDAWGALVTTAVGRAPQLLETGAERVRRFGVVSGAAASYLEEARAAGCDALLTGEGRHASYFEAEELGINLCLAGHYATECFGVKALGQHLAAQFGLDWQFIDHDTGL